MFALAEEGYSVSFRDIESTNVVRCTKEIVTYTSRNKNEAIAWADAMEKDGYEVHISFDSTTGVYTCTAVK